MIQVAAAAMKNGPWQGSNGVITEGASPNTSNDGVYFKCESPFSSALHFVPLRMDTDVGPACVAAAYVRALNEAFMNTNNRDFGTLIHSYLVVQVCSSSFLSGSASTLGSRECLLVLFFVEQYNAIIELAANGSTYSSAWAGPPQGYTGWGQAAALDNLVSAITSTT